MLLRLLFSKNSVYHRLCIFSMGIYIYFEISSFKSTHGKRKKKNQMFLKFKQVYFINFKLLKRRPSYLCSFNFVSLWHHLSTLFLRKKINKIKKLKFHFIAETLNRIKYIFSQINFCNGPCIFQKRFCFLWSFVNILGNLWFFKRIKIP